MSNLSAFKLRSDFLEELQGATIAYGPETRLYNIKEALEAGDGTIVTDDATLAATLSGVDILEAAEVPQKYALTEVPGGGDKAAEGNPVIFQSQGGILDIQEGNLIAAQHEAEAQTVEEAVEQGAPPPGEQAPAPETPAVPEPVVPPTPQKSSQSSRPQR